MKTVIVPVDFSKTSLNAALYSTKLLTGYYGVNMILFHVFENESDSEEVHKGLAKLREALMTEGIVKITTEAICGKNFIATLEQFCMENPTDLIIMGITGKSGIEQTFMGSNTLKMVEKKVCPVLIIPEKANFEEVKNVLLTTDFKESPESLPAENIKNVLTPFRPDLHILNVNSEIYISISEEYRDEKENIAKLFPEFNPKFYFLGLYDVDEAINQFADDKNIDFIIVIHKDHNLFSKFFTRSHTKELAYKSKTPVLAIHQ